MLARRFTIVCLLTALFGFGLSNLVARTAGQSPSWAVGMLPPCNFACMPQDVKF